MLRAAAAGGNCDDRRAAPYVYLPVPARASFPDSPAHARGRFRSSSPLPPFSSAVARGMDLFASHLPLLPGKRQFDRRWRVRTYVHDIRWSVSLHETDRLVATVRTSGRIIRRTEMYVRATWPRTTAYVAYVASVALFRPGGGDRIRGNICTQLAKDSIG